MSRSPDTRRRLISRAYAIDFSRNSSGERRGAIVRLLPSNVQPYGVLRSAASPGSVGFGRPVSGASGLLITLLPAGLFLFPARTLAAGVRRASVLHQRAISCGQFSRKERGGVIRSAAGEVGHHRSVAASPDPCTRAEARTRGAERREHAFGSPLVPALGGTRSRNATATFMNAEVPLARDRADVTPPDVHGVRSKPDRSERRST